jgi:hypothetical protein
VDAAGVSASRGYSFTINAAPTLGALTPPQWTVGQAGYTGVVPITGGTGPFTVVAQSNLPPGLTATLTGASIVFTCTSTTVGTYGNIQLTLRDATGATSTGTFSILVNQAPTLVPPWSSAPAWTVNQPYGTTISVIRGTGPVGGLTATGLPPGLTASLSRNTITLSGTPTTTGYFSPITVGVVDAAGASAQATFSMTMNAAMTMGSLTVSQWQVGEASYPGTITVTGGTQPWSLASATGLPPGLGVNLRGGVGSPLTVFFTGTPTTVGTYGNVQITVQDVAGATVSGTFSITITLPPLITTIAGNGGQGFGGEGGPATSATLNSPYGVAVDASGNVFFPDQGNNRVREIVKATGDVITVAGTGVAGFSGDGGAATATAINGPEGLAFDASGDLFFGDGNNNRIRELVKATGTILTVAGNGTYDFSGDGGSALSAELAAPRGIAFDASGNLYIADANNNRIRKVLSGSIGPQLALPPDRAGANAVGQTLTSADLPAVVAEAIRLWAAGRD